MNSSLEGFLGTVAQRGGYEAQGEAATALRAVLEVLGGHLVGDDRMDLAALLPQQCAPLLAEAVPASEPLTPDAFIDAVAERESGDPTEARRAVVAVLGALSDAVDDALLRRIITQLPPGHAGLFGRTDPH
ncbi:DUF2267 domain-containing protein [Streptomyces sp. NPDC052114]|uniref:DUF2267 domain-containing protein n=1 Tax=unclassified Streptomyces TaxID=2593676 RepID=UPI00343E75E1